MATKESVTSSYRLLARLISRLPESNTKQKDNAWRELRNGFRKSLSNEETVESRLRLANERISFLRMTTPKRRTSNQSGEQRFVYKDGQKFNMEEEMVTTRDGKRVHTNWDGTNMDPCAVKRHYAGLKRCGFINNAHCKGFF